MNKARRKKIDTVIGKIQALCGEVEALRDKEQEYYDNMPEGIQNGLKGDVANTAIENLESAINSLNEAEEYLTASQGEE